MHWIKYHIYIMTHIKLHFCEMASPEGGIHWLLLKSFCLTTKFGALWLRYFGRRPPKFWARCLSPDFPVHILTFPHRDKMFLITDRTICWLQNFFKQTFKALFIGNRHHISAMRPDIKNLEPTNCFNSDFGTFIQPKLSLNFNVEAHFFPS